MGLTGVEKAEAGLRRFANAGSQQAKKLALSWADCGKKMTDVGSLMRKTAAFVGGGALLTSAIKDVTEFERGLMEMKLTGGLTAKEMENIRKQILDLSGETLQLPEDQLAAFKDMVAAGIDPKEAIKGMKAINRTATAAFADVRDIGAATVDLFQKMKIDPSKMERAFNIMHAGGKAGRFELKDMARYFPEVTSDAAKFGMVNEKGVAQLVAMLQIARKGTSNASEAANNMRNFFAQIMQYREEFAKLKINVFDFIDVKTGKFKAGKDFDMFFEDIVKKTGGSAAKLQLAGIRDRQSMDFIVQMMQNWQEYQKIRDEALKSADASIVGKDFDEVTKTTYGGLKKLEIEKSKAMKEGGSSWFARTASGIGNWAVENPLLAAGGALGGYLGLKGLKRYVGGKLGGTLPGKLGEMASGLGVQKVFVTNFPKSEPIHGGKDPFNLGKKAPTTFAGRLKDLFTGRGTDKLLGAGGLKGMLKGGITVAGAGAGTTALLGTIAAAGGYAVGTGINWLINKGVSGITGGKNDSLGAWLYDFLHKKENPEVKNNITMNVRIDDKGRVFAETSDMNTKANINTMKRGQF